MLLSADPWFPDEINDGHAEYLFYLLSALMGVFFLGYLMVAKLYRYKHFDEDQDGQEGQSIEASSSSQRKPAERFGSDTGF